MPSAFSLTRFRKNKGETKLHTIFDLRGNIPSFIEIRDGKVADVNILDILIPEPGSFYIMDRGYLDFERLYRKYLWKIRTLKFNLITTTIETVQLITGHA